MPATSPPPGSSRRRARDPRAARSRGTASPGSSRRSTRSRTSSLSRPVVLGARGRRPALANLGDQLAQVRAQAAGSTASFAANSAPARSMRVSRTCHARQSLPASAVGTVSGAAGRREDSFGLLQVRPVDHPAVDAPPRPCPARWANASITRRAQATSSGRRAERRMDRRDLRRVDRELADETVASRRRARAVRRASTSRNSMSVVSIAATPAAAAMSRQEARREPEREFVLAVGRCGWPTRRRRRRGPPPPRCSRRPAPAACAKAAAFSTACAVSVTSAMTLIEPSSCRRVLASSASSQ